MKMLILFLLSSFILFAQESNIKTAYLQSYNYEKMSSYDEAIKVLLPIYKQYPNGYTLNLRLGWLLFLSKKYANAKKYYMHATLINNYALNPKLGLIRIALIKASYQEVEKQTNELLKIDFYNYYANIYLAQALIAEKKYDIAYKVVTKMLALYPTDISYLELLGLIYQKTDSPKLQKLYENILLLDPNNVFVKSRVKVP